ncbi:putative lipoprotein with Yx(FWY)xxD motif [Saccharopolyspora phatthalungensis]|uniref:Putative lipoprotein with Yx(FWY)xxD motif n=1 Tax=Saccharopolyspora phatthalungensis TaxID=664693 RepID=A0A840QKQ2_9PSEU|nr:putative lipoprotein with Yx(FWY)xxD motif [Saccharopolyspora phatthalungensis]
MSVAAFAAAGVLSLAGCGAVNDALGQIPAAPGAPVAESANAGLAMLAGTAKANNAQAGTGDWATGSDGTANTADQKMARKWVQLKASQAGDLNPVVVNGAGLTLYRFDKDTAQPSKSNCNGDCAKTWPPLTVAPGSKVFLAGVPKSAVGTVKRDDGSLQLTLGGWPVYRFAKDTKPGDTKGQGVGGTWFGVAPDGQKAQAESGGSDAGQNPQDGAAQSAGPADRAILFDDANFSDNGASQGVSGQGCQNVARPGVTSSVSAGGSLKLWSEKNCKGKSLVINGDVRDLGKLGFDNRVASVFFG